ncbi:MAG TPA: helix-turn-helix domain-containing protein [Candidatus Saccharimonadales bacterium]|jgi:DNA-binding transcriptional ArsR family regulator|nr:helix-turn-helix domain-containing protein [Candidatus Saccharimonadales bacterium]
MAKPELQFLRTPAQASALLHNPLRLRILAALAQPDSATAVARRMNLPRQTVNYHVRELARAKFLTRAGRRKRRRLFEQCYITTAHAYLFSPEILGSLAIDPAHVQDRFSASYLLGLSAKMQSELSLVTQRAEERSQQVATLSLNTELRFTSAAQRAKFAEQLQAQIMEVIVRHASPYQNSDDTPAAGRPFRLILGCYPIPASGNDRSDKEGL